MFFGVKSRTCEIANVEMDIGLGWVVLKFGHVGPPEANAPHSRPNTSVSKKTIDNMLGGALW
jgi:hypothetical protein